MSDAEGTYLIWSHEHGGWWGPERSGYVRRLFQAGRYSHTEAIEICSNAMPGDSTRIGALPELPVRLADLNHMVGRYISAFGDREEPWR